MKVVGLLPGESFFNDLARHLFDEVNPEAVAGGDLSHLQVLVPALPMAAELRAALANGGSVTLSDNMTVKEPLVVENGKTVEIDLNGHTITNETDVWAGNDWSLFSVRGGTLTIKNGTVKAKDNDCYACDVQYGGTLIIEDGTFVGNISAVYVHEGKAEIKGGTFSIVQTETEGDPYRFLLNCYDSNRQAGKASIVVTGGTFENFNPADNAAEGAGTNFVDEGYKAVKIAETPAPNGTFQVVKNAKVDNADELIGALADPEIANIEVASDIDLAAKSSEELTFEEHKTIDIKEGMTLQLGSANFLTAEKGLTLTGKGTLDNSAAASTAVVAAASDVHVGPQLPSVGYSRRRFALPRGRFDRKPVAERQGHRSTIRTADGNSGRRRSLRPYGRYHPGSGIGSRHRTGDPRSETGEGGRRFQNDPLQPLGTRTDRPVRLRTVFRRKTPGLRNFGRRNPQYAQRVGKNYLTA